MTEQTTGMSFAQKFHQGSGRADGPPARFVGSPAKETRWRKRARRR